MLTKVKTKLRHLINYSFGTSQPTKKESLFSDDSLLGVKRRHYASYGDYLHHQAEKLGKIGESIVQSDQEYEQLVIERYRDLFDLHGKSILCLGARLGGEVRAFKALGALAVGIDIEPGPGNCHVLHGDFHSLLFPDECFDYAFTNVVDHVLYLDQFIAEVSRVLKPAGDLLVELAQVEPGNYEVLDTSDIQPILKPFQKYFDIILQTPVVNKTQYIHWEGQFLQFKKVPTVG